MAELCCGPIGEAPLSDAEAAELAGLLRVLADPVRLRLLSLIAMAPAGVCACDLVDSVGRSQPTVSHHLKVLTEAGLLERERRGRWVWYWQDPARLDSVRQALLPSTDEGDPSSMVVAGVSTG